MTYNCCLCNHTHIKLQRIIKLCRSDNINPFNPKYPEWYSPCLDLEHTTQVCRGERVKNKILGIHLLVEE